jgi:hypothetical protein
MRVRLTAVLVAFLAAAACGSQPAAPQPPSSAGTPSIPPPLPEPTGPQPNFIVARGMNVVAEGARSELSAISFTRATEQNAYLLGLQQSAIVSAGTYFQPLDASVAASSGAAILGRAAGSTSIRASYYGRDYDLPFVVVRPTASLQPLAGTWRGTGTRTCQDLVGNTRSCYWIDGKQSPRTLPVTLTLSYEAGVLTGSIALGGPGSGFTLLSGPAFGGIDQDGRLAIGGFAGEPGHGYHEQLRDWRFDVSGSQLIGAGANDAAFINVYGPVLHRVTFSSITLTREF